MLQLFTVLLIIMGFQCGHFFQKITAVIIMNFISIATLVQIPDFWTRASGKCWYRISGMIGTAFPVKWYRITQFNLMAPHHVMRSLLRY